MLLTKKASALAAGVAAALSLSLVSLAQDPAPSADRGG